MKYFAFLLTIVLLSGCAMISKQYYYEPSGPHQKIKGHYSHSDFKMIYNKIAIKGRSGDSIGSVIISNGVGHPLLMGPVVPVIPVGGFFQKSRGGFSMDMDVHCINGYFMALAIDSNNYKKKRDSLNVLKQYTAGYLNTRQCYMIVNDTLKVPLKAKEYFMDSSTVHSYMFESDIRFRKVKTLRLFTGNSVLDSNLKNITFKRKSRIKFDLMMLGY